MVEILRMLRKEHASLGKVLDVLEREIETYEERGRLNREIVRDVIEYCRGYPVLCHHPKEDLIYRKLRLVAEPEAFDTVCDLVAEHETLAALIDVERLLWTPSSMIVVPRLPIPDSFFKAGPIEAFLRVRSLPGGMYRAGDQFKIGPLREFFLTDRAVSSL